MIKKSFTINEKSKDLGLLKKVRKRERLRGDFRFWKLFWESCELFSARHEHSISVPDSTSLITALLIRRYNTFLYLYQVWSRSDCQKFIIKRKIHLLLFLIFFF